MVVVVVARTREERSLPGPGPRRIATPSPRFSTYTTYRPPPSSSSSSSSPPLPDHRYSAPAPASAPPLHLSAPSLFQPKLEEQGRAGEGRELEWFSNKVFRRERKKWKIDSFFPFFLSFLRSNFWKINYIRKSSSDEVVSF